MRVKKFYRMKRLKHFYMCIKHIFKPLRHRVLILMCISTFIVILFKLGLICTSMQSRLHIQHVCDSYARGQSVGKLCKELCHPQSIHPSFSCYFYMEKEAVFSGIWMNTNAVFKSSKMISSDNGLLNRFDSSIFSENIFLDMIKTLIKLKFNISINNKEAKRMSFTHGSLGGNRLMEIENVWSLLQNNEYLALFLYEKSEIFPKLLGTCGSLYAVQKLNSVSGFWHLMTLYDSQNEWQKRIKLSLMILDYLFHLENVLPEPLFICDVKMTHFGVTDDFKKIMYLDLDSVHPVSIVNRLTGDRSECRQHSDCDLGDCRSFCNLVTLKCQHDVANNNLQIVCEKIFLGWMMSGRVMVPGLLLGPRTPRVLIEILESCANPASETGVPRAPASKEIRKRLYNLLVHLTIS